MSDKIASFNVLILMSLITGVITLSWPFMTTLPTLIAFSILFGFVSGGLMPLGSACVAQISPDLEHIGFRLGMAMAICSIGVLAGGPISGHLWEMYFDESGMQFFAGGATILGAVVLTVARFLSRREVLVAF
jgi:MFS family permease